MGHSDGETRGTRHGIYQVQRALCSATSKLPRPTPVTSLAGNPRGRGQRAFCPQPVLSGRNSAEPGPRACDMSSQEYLWAAGWEDCTLQTSKKLFLPPIPSGALGIPSRTFLQLLPYRARGCGDHGPTTCHHAVPPRDCPPDSSGEPRQGRPRTLCSSPLL